MGKVENFTDTVRYDVYTFGISSIQIDIIRACKGLEFADSFEHAEKFNIDSKVEINVVEYHTLIKVKKAAGRACDLADIEELEKIRNSRKD